MRKRPRRAWMLLTLAGLLSRLPWSRRVSALVDRLLAAAEREP